MSIDWVRLCFGRGSLLRYSAAASTATAGDFTAVVLLVSYCTLPPWLATALGYVLGVVISFSICRFWAFGSCAPVLPQFRRYALIDLTGMLLNAGGVAAITHFTFIDYRLGWAMVRFSVFLLWNFRMKASFVFPPAERGGTEDKKTPPV